MVLPSVKILIEGVDKFSKPLKEVTSAIKNTGKIATVGLLTSSIAHEINNPIDIIQTKIYLLKKKF